MHTGYLIVAVIAGIGELILTFKLFFDDFADYSEAWHYSVTPDFWSMFKGEYFEDLQAEFKLGIYHGGGILTAGGVYLGLDKLFSASSPV